MFTSYSSPYCYKPKTLISVCLSATHFYRPKSIPCVEVHVHSTYFSLTDNYKILSAIEKPNIYGNCVLYV